MTNSFPFVFWHGSQRLVRLLEILRQNLSWWLLLIILLWRSSWLILETSLSVLLWSSCWLRMLSNKLLLLLLVVLRNLTCLPILNLLSFSSYVWLLHVIWRWILNRRLLHLWYKCRLTCNLRLHNLTSLRVIAITSLLRSSSNITNVIGRYVFLKRPVVLIWSLVCICGWH